MKGDFILLTTKATADLLFVRADRIVYVVEDPAGTVLRLDDGTADGDAVAIGESFDYVRTALERAAGENDDESGDGWGTVSQLHPGRPSAAEDR